MEDAQLLVYIFSTILVGMNFAIGLFLLKRTLHTGLKNVLHLCFYFFFTVLEFISKLLFAFGRPLAGINLVSLTYFIINLTGHIFILFFVKFTFYKERRSAYPYLLISFIIAKFTYIITYSITEIDQSQLYYNITRFLSQYIIFTSSIWLLYASFSEYSKFRNQNVRPWIRHRYHLIGISAAFLAMQVIPLAFLPHRGSFSDPQMAIMIMFLTILNIIFAILSYIAWVMPKRLKVFFDRNYQDYEDLDLPEEDLIEQIQNQLKEGGNNGDT